MRYNQALGGAGTDSHSSEVHNVPPAVTGTAGISAGASPLSVALEKDDVLFQRDSHLHEIGTSQ